jgi:hypothetical protein
MSSSILASTRELLSPCKSLWNDPLNLLQMADKEALLVHIVAIVGLYDILGHLLLRNSKILPIRVLRVRFVPLVIYGVEIFGL